MKAIMYHYVRPEDENLKYFKALNVEDFEKQLEYFGNQYGFVTKSDFLKAINSGEKSDGVILTFDDGFKDHYKYVYPLLKKYDLWGLFYIPTSPFITNQLIDVHRIHMILGKYGGKEIAKHLDMIMDESMLNHSHIKEFENETYSRQDNDLATNYVKRVLNYYIDYSFRSMLIDNLMGHYFENEKVLSESFYMTESEIDEMNKNGMLIGSHTVNHYVMSKLSILEQEYEIKNSFSTLANMITAPLLKTFCYPYGGFHSFTKETEEALENQGCLFSFNVEPRDIDLNDLRFRKQALPRYDCNQFPFGKIRN